MVGWLVERDPRRALGPVYSYDNRYQRAGTTFLFIQTPANQ
jgi:hypothetical protein